MRTTRVFPLAAALLALGMTGCGGDFRKDEPQTAVRDFLGEALVQQNGQRACDYLTQDAQAAIAATGPVGSACREAMEKAELVDDGEAVVNTGEVNDLSYETTTEGHEATVKVDANGRELTFTLKHDDGLGNLYEPETPWRITGGAEALVRGS